MRCARVVNPARTGVADVVRGTEHGEVAERARGEVVHDVRV